MAGQSHSQFHDRLAIEDLIEFFDVGDVVFFYDVDDGETFPNSVTFQLLLLQELGWHNHTPSVNYHRAWADIPDKLKEKILEKHEKKNDY